MRNWKKKDLFLLYMYDCLSAIYMCVPCAQNARGGQKKALGPMEVKLKMVVSFHMDAGN